LGRRIKKRELREILGSFPHCPLARIVTKDLDRSHNLAVRTPNRTNPDLHRNPVPALMVKVNVRSMRQAILEGAAERAISFTEQAPGVINVHKEVIRASPAQNFLSRVPGKCLRCVVPVGYPPLPIGDIDAVREAVYYMFKGRLHFIGGKSRKTRHWGVHRFSLSSGMRACRERQSVAFEATRRWIG